MARAQVLILHGHQLATNHHYALALIVQRCNELRHHCDIITNAIRTKRASLTRARDLLHRLEDVRRSSQIIHLLRSIYHLGEKKPHEKISHTLLRAELKSYMAPQYIKDLLQQHTTSRAPRSSTQSLLSVPQTCFKTYRRQLFPVLTT